MKTSPINQNKLFGLEEYMIDLVNLFENKKLPSKILLSGQKGIGKCTLAYHLINYILSKNETSPYDIKNFIINNQNKSFLLVNNQSSQNLILIDLLADKKNIDITQIRELILNLNKSSFNNKPKFVLLDNIELLNKNAVNALLKILEEPNRNIYFILINNNKKIYSTLSSRCLNFKISLSNKKKKEIIIKILGENFENLINSDLIDYYSSPGHIYRLIAFSNLNKIDLKEISLPNLILLIINENYYKKDTFAKDLIFDLVENFFVKKTLSSPNAHDRYSYFIKRISDTKKYNLDYETLFIEFKNELSNG